MSDPTLPQALLLLAVDGASGAVHSPACLGMGLAAACLAELALTGRIVVQPLERPRGLLNHDSRLVHVVSPAPTDLPSCDAVLAAILGDGPRTAQHWVSRFHRSTLAVVADELVRRGILRRQERRGLARTVDYPFAVPQPDADVRAGLDAVLRFGAPPTPHAAALAMIADAIALPPRVVPGLAGKARTPRVRELAAGPWSPPAPPDVVAAVDAAAHAAWAVVVASE